MERHPAADGPAGIGSVTGMSSADPAVEIRLERIQAAVDVGNAETKGALAMLMLRSDQTEKIANERAARLDAELRDRDARLAVELKERDDRMDKSEKAASERHTALESRVHGLSKQVWLLVGGAGALSGGAAAVVQVLMKR